MENGYFLRLLRKTRLFWQTLRRMKGERRGCFYKLDDGHVLFWICLN